MPPTLFRPSPTEVFNRLCKLRPPERVLICDNIPLQFTVSNKGTGTAANVKPSDKLPEGLKPLMAKQPLIRTQLTPGQSVSCTGIVRADKTNYTNKAVAVADGTKANWRNPHSCHTTDFAIEKTGPARTGSAARFPMTLL